MDRKKTQEIRRRLTTRYEQLLESIIFEDPDRGVRVEAMDALDELPQARARRVLRKIIDRHPDAQMREEGFGDPSIGKQVRLLVGALATRVDWWRRTRNDEMDWADAVRFSIYRDDPPLMESAVTFSSEALRRFNEGLSGFDDRDVIGGKVG